MGFDLPAAIGAKIARPEAQVLCFVGDGSLQMNIQELATIAELNLDIKIIVLDNHALNIVAQFQRQNWNRIPRPAADTIPIRRNRARLMYSRPHNRHRLRGWKRRSPRV